MTIKERKQRNEAKRQNTCLCGCKTKVKGHFAQGHDQRFRGFVLRVEEGKASAQEQAAVRAAKSALLSRGVTQPNAQLLRTA